ncbi:DNA cross-link repair 1A protein isoform X2 [Rhinatrema bivittatum]|nr:DNA cross-link repair 1A protein isoform X2 [Rhinatrema bivittatum]
MPFSILLVQTPRWHVAECLDTPGCTDKECPDGLQCSSTIPSHYKRYAHFLLARHRSGDDDAGSQMCSPDSKTFSPDAAQSSCFAAIKEETSGSPKQTEDRNVLCRQLHLPMTSSSQKGEPAGTCPNVDSASTQRKGKGLTQRTLQFTPSENPKERFGFSQSWDSQVGGDAGSPKATEQFHQPPLTLDSDPSNVDISYSPLFSEEDDIEEDRRLKRSRKRLFSTGKTEDEQSETEAACFIPLNKVSEIPEARGYGCHGPGGGGFTPPADQGEEGCDLGSSDGLTGQAPGLSSSAECAAILPRLRPEVLTGNPPSSLDHEAIKEESDWPEFSSPVSGTNRSNSEDVPAFAWLSPPLVRGRTVQSVKAEEKAVVFHSSQGLVLEEQKLKDDVCSNNLSGKGFHCVSGFNNSLSVSAQQANPRLSQVTSARCQNGPLKSSASPPGVKGSSSKGLKQMDIGVFFGLKPKAKEEREEKHLAQVKQSTSPVAAPSGKRPRQTRRKAEGSVAGTEAVVSGAWNTGAVSAEAPKGGQRGWRRRPGEPSTAEGRARKQCPFYKKIPGTGFAVDAFQYGEIEGCTAYFLTHFHSDHYGGLTKKFTFPIYCSKVTGNLVRSKLHVQEQYINALPMESECMVNGVKVVLLEANHCPGAVLFLFCLSNGTVVLHTGDFRAHPSMERYPALIGRKIHTLYLDTTYCSPEYTFPSQQEAVQFAVNAAFEAVTLHPWTLVVCGTYSVGKEKVFLAVADVLGCKVSVSEDKYKTLQCLESQQVQGLLTTDWNSTGLHVLPMMQINFKGLLNHLSKFSKYDRVLAFKPTGWTYSDRFSSVADIRPEIRGNITIYGIPYSEHSSYLEMKRFVQWLRPQKIIPTVNSGSWKSRATMEKYFREWMAEAAQSRASHWSKDERFSH